MRCRNTSSSVERRTRTLSGHESSLVERVRRSVAVGRVQQDSIGQRLDALDDSVGPVAQVVRPAAVVEAQLDDLPGRVLLDERARRALGDDLPVVHDDEAVAELLGLVHVVGREQKRHTLPLEAVEPVPDDVTRLRVEAGRRLVEEQHLGLVDERARDRQPALHAARERLDLVVRALRELDEVEELVGARAEVLPGQPEVAAVDDDVLADGQLHVERVLLRHDAEPRADLRAVAGGIDVEHAQRPLRDGRDAPDHAHRRRLARAVRAEEAERLAALQVEVDRVDGDEVAEALHEIACLDQRSAVRGHPRNVSYPAAASVRPSSPRRRGRSASTSAASLSNTASSRRRSQSSTTSRLP